MVSNPTATVHRKLIIALAARRTNASSDPRFD
jgi:hypothetical protein